MVGWKYMKWGTCTECKNDDAGLYVPVLDGAPSPHDGSIIRGRHLDNFPPLCKGCSKKYALDNLCKVCRTPMKREKGKTLCRNCLN